jgi:hypothetical protein
MNSKRDRTHGYLGVIVFTHENRGFQTNGAITESGSFSATGNNPNVLSHKIRLISISGIKA